MQMTPEMFSVQWIHWRNAKMRVRVFFCSMPFQWLSLVSCRRRVYIRLSRSNINQLIINMSKNATTHENNISSPSCVVSTLYLVEFFVCCMFGDVFSRQTLTFSELPVECVYVHRKRRNRQQFHFTK